MADSVSTSSGVEEVDVEKICSDDEKGPSYEQEEEPTQNYNLEGTEDGDELQPLQLEEEDEEEEEEEEGSEGEDGEEQEEAGEGINLQMLGEELSVDVDVLRSLLGVDQHFAGVLANLEHVLNDKSRLVTEYAMTLQQFSDNLTKAERTNGELFF
jgi:hypothetical protein